MTPVGEIAMRHGAGGRTPSVYLRDPEGNTVELRAAGNLDTRSE